MAEVSRTARVIQNAKVALFFYCINLVLQFFSRKIFLDYLGAELLGLNTTAQNLLQFLNLAESGIGAAVAFALYKPLSQKNRQEIIDIVSLQGWFYRWVGLFVIVGSIVLMAFFPWIFAKADVPLIYAYGTFIAFLISALLGYFVNYKMIVLSADQKEYKITIETQGIKIIKVFIQIIVIWKFPYGYIFWIILETLAAIVTSIRLVRCVKKEYPWLIVNIGMGKELAQKYPFVLTKTKQMFFHRFGGFVLHQITPLIIYMFTTLTDVAIYGNYMIVMAGCFMFIDAVFRGFSASVGNLISENDRHHIRQVFWKILTLRLFSTGFLCCGVFLLSEPFVILWVGTDYVMDKVPMLALVAIYFIQMNKTSEMFLWGSGLFQDIWAPIAEAILNIALSVLMGMLWGLTGVFIGVLISQIVIVNSWKPIFLFISGFNEPIKEYVIKYTMKMFFLFIIFFVVCYTYNYLAVMQVETYLEWCLNALCFVSLYMTIGTMIFYISDIDFRDVSRQLTSTISKKVKSNLR